MNDWTIKKLMAPFPLRKVKQLSVIGKACGPINTARIYGQPTFLDIWCTINEVVLKCYICFTNLKKKQLHTTNLMNFRK